MRTAAAIMVAMLLPFLGNTQTTQTIGANLIDNEEISDMLDSIVVNARSTKVKRLDGNGTKIPGACIYFSPSALNAELGSVIEIKSPFLVQRLSFSVLLNKIEGCKASIRIYRMHSEDSLTNIITMPITQFIPTADSKTTFNIVPQEGITLEKGQYYISLSITEVSPSATEEHKLHFPLYVKSSYMRADSASPLVKRKYNIGLIIRGVSI